MQTENVTPFETFSKCIGLPGLLSMMKIESERYAAENGRQFQISEEEFCPFLGVNLLMGINKLPTMKSYWSVAEDLGNSLIQKAITQPEAHQSIDEHMCKFKAKSIMRQYMRNKPIK